MKHFMPFDHPVHIFCTMVLAIFIVCKPSMRLVGSLIVVKKVSTSSARLCTESFRLAPMPQRQGPAASSPNMYLHSPAAEPFAAFARHTFADSNEQVPCTLTERTALTVVTTSCDVERSCLLRLHTYISCKGKHVPQHGVVDFHIALSIPLWLPPPL